MDVTCAVKSKGVEIRTLARTTAVTGVEMEALVAASVAALTVYDMCKALDKGIEIREVRLERKSGGKSGDYARKSGEEKVMMTAAVLTVSDSVARGERDDLSGPGNR